MIEGIQLDFKSAEIKDHLLERIRHHKEREAFYLTQVKKVRMSGAERTQYGTDPLSALEQKAERHRDRRELFAVMAQHIVPNEVYRLREEDLGRIELLSQSRPRKHLR